MIFKFHSIFAGLFGWDFYQKLSTIQCCWKLWTVFVFVWNGRAFVCLFVCLSVCLFVRLHVCLFDLNNRQNGRRAVMACPWPAVPILTLGILPPVCPTVHPSSCPFHSTLPILISHILNRAHPCRLPVQCAHTFPPYHFTEEPSSQTTPVPSFACVRTSVDQT